MALSGKYISVRRILEELYGDNQFDFELPYESIIRWTASIMKLMQCPDIYIAKVTGYIANPNLDITNYRAKLPCDFFKMRQIAVNGLPATYVSNTFHHLMDGDCCGVDQLGTSSGDEFTDNFGNVFNTALGFRESSGEITYDINNDYITLSVKEGKVCLSYWAFPTDDDGYPMIPDDEAFIEATKQYCNSKLRYIAWSKEPSNNGLKALYEDAKQEYMWYVGKAINNAKMPDIDRMEAIKNQFLRMRPRVNQHDSFFRYLGQSERKYNK